MRFSMMWPSVFTYIGSSQELNFNMLQGLLRVTFREIDIYNVSYFIHFIQLTS